MRMCAWCGEGFTPPATGRPPRFCSDACRKARHQRVRTLRRRAGKFERLAAVNAEPWRSHYSARAAEVLAELGELEEAPPAA